MSASMFSFMLARGGGTSLKSSTLYAPVGILFKHCAAHVSTTRASRKSGMPGR
jgi:hypothetical protein